MTTPIDVILPIYRGLESLQVCLASLIAAPQRRSFQLILINDASPEPAIHAWLSDFVARHPQLELLENPVNLGFVGTVNRGMALHPERDVLLLNSDTEVHGDWLDRLAACAGSRPGVASVTPFSNNATVCSWPRCCEENPLPVGFSLAEIDAAFARANPGLSIELPTAVGFCMYIPRAALDQVGLFDVETFGKGYGEENDFCRRAVAAGLVNLLCCDTFVLHAGGHSFAGEKNRRAEQAQVILDRRYPDYHRLVMEHIQRDQAASARLAAWLELLRASPRPRILHLTHHLGGGTAKHVAELFDHLADQADFLLIRPIDGGMELDLSGHRREMMLRFRLPQDYPDLLQLLRGIGLSAVHFHHTLGLETCLWGLPGDLGLPLDITLHDYYFLNANPTQTDSQGRYQAEMENQARPYPLPVSVAEWQANQCQLLNAARRVIAPSAFAAELYRRWFPDARYQVAFHPEWEQWAPYPDVRQPALTADQPLRVLVFGAISIEKGADLLEGAALAAKRQGLPLAFELLGYAYRPLDGLIEHGSYDHQRVVRQVQQLDPHLIWFTATWPETYSYTLSEALAAGYPIVAPSHGSFPERLRDRPLTWIAPWDQSIDDWLALFQTIRDQFISAASEHLSWAGQLLPQDGDHFYLHNYVCDAPNPATEPLPSHAQLTDWLTRAIDPDSGLRRRERLLVRLVRLRQGWLGRWLSKLLPVMVQRYIKRKLSRKPIHELV